MKKVNFKMIMIDYYSRCIQKCKNTENEKNKIKNLNKELEKIL